MLIAMLTANYDDFMLSLEIMWKGMAGIFIVIIVITLITLILAKVTTDKKESTEE